MADRRMHRHTPPRNPIDATIREVVREEIAELKDAPFSWVCWRAWARSPEHARRLAEREGIRLTKIGRDVFGARADLDAMAARNVIVPGAANDDDDDGIDPEVAAAFGGGAQ